MSTQEASKPPLGVEGPIERLVFLVIFFFMLYIVVTNLIPIMQGTMHVSREAQEAYDFETMNKHLEKLRKEIDQEDAELEDDEDEGGNDDKKNK